MWFATSGTRGDDQIGVLGSWGVGGDVEDLKALAVVAAPRAFSRIHLQSGYFFCAPRDRLSLGARATVLRFKRTAAVEPVVPTWTLLTGGRDAQSVNLLEDPLRMEAHLRAKLPRRTSHRFPPPIEVNGTTLGMLKRAALESLLTGAGRHGIMPDGRAYFEIKPGLVYCMVRFAPHHFLQYAMATWIRHAAGERDSEQVLALLLTGLMLYLGIAPDIKPHEPARIPADDDVRRLIQHALDVIGGSDLDRLDWPISDWYSPTAKQTSSINLA